MNKTIIWEDKQLLELEDVRDLQGLVDEYFDDVITSLFYPDNILVRWTTTLEGLQADSPPSGSITLPACIGIENGKLVQINSLPVHVLSGTYSPHAGSHGNTAGETPRTDTIVARWASSTGDPKDVWFIDPTNDTKDTVFKNSREISTFEIGIIRGEPGSYTPLPFGPFENDWFILGYVDVTEGLLITQSDITQIPVPGSYSDVFDPVTGHRHFGIQTPDAPQLIHGESGGPIPPNPVIPQSIDPSTIGINDHHNMRHDIADLAQHSGELDPINHGYLTSTSSSSWSSPDGPLHDFTALVGGEVGTPNSLATSGVQHGLQPALIGGGIHPTALHAVATTVDDGFMSASDYNLLHLISLSNFKYIGKFAYEIHAPGVPTVQVDPGVAPNGVIVLFSALLSQAAPGVGGSASTRLDLNGSDLVGVEYILDGHANLAVGGSVGMVESRQVAIVAPEWNPAITNFIGFGTTSPDNVESRVRNFSVVVMGF